jgi:hypothetical protein
MKDETQGFLLKTIIQEYLDTQTTTILDCVARLEQNDAQAEINRPNETTQTFIYTDDERRKEFCFVTKRGGEFYGNGGIVPYKGAWSIHT